MYYQSLKTMLDSMINKLPTTLNKLPFTLSGFRLNDKIIY